ncbi:hypothetical protein ABZY09_18440 [Streptomyces sp. NPDC002928]|uniref:hypothetical protein n=1 Tax=Streptomyces sp. NPDC002928 TaxID=3154440 RepID=UPI00339F4C3E
MTSALISAAVALLVSVISSFAALRLQTARLRAELKTEFMAEEAIRQLLLHPDWVQRSFELIERRIGGFPADELRQLLVRAGAVRFEGAGGKEMWGLRERNLRQLQ